MRPGEFCTYAHSEYRNRAFGDPHDHDFHEFFWVDAGEGFHWINGRRLPLQRGDLVLIRASDAHTFSAASEGGLLRIGNFAFLASIWRDFHRRYFDRAPAFFSLESLEERSYRLTPAQFAFLHQAAAPLRAGHRDRLQTEAFLLAALSLFKADRLVSIPSTAPDWMRRACAGIAANRNFARGMPALVHLAGRSPEHVAREFRRHLGRTPTDVINEARTAHAAERLAATEESIVSISLDCGLENLSHFYRIFRARYGCTPRAYRMRQRHLGEVR